MLTAGAKFDVDNTGVITIVSTLDYEVSTSETFVVQMCEADPAINTLCDSTTVQVTVTDENDNSPIFAATSYTATITEEQTNSNFLTITATDADDGKSFFSSYYPVVYITTVRLFIMNIQGMQNFDHNKDFMIL